MISSKLYVVIWMLPQINTHKLLYVLGSDAADEVKISVCCEIIRKTQVGCAKKMPNYF